MSRHKIRRCGLMAAVGLTALSTLAAQAQPTQAGRGVPNAMQGFSQNQGKPIKIEAATLEVHDKEKQKFATFEGDVHVTQGDTDMRCKTLVVYYDDDPAPARKAAVRPAQPSQQSGAPPPQQPQQIKRLDAKGGVIITQKDQIATGESGVYELRTSLMTLIGNVVLTKGGDVIRGDRLWVNMNTGVSRVESANTGQGVRAVFNPSAAHDALGAPDTSKPSPGRPPRPN
jgi:lipopolysaccharide export system protein LptA